VASLPTGTLTFLFTDIEGSTKLWERHPEAMQIALARHDEILRDATEQHGGYVFKTVGDAFCCAFPTAPHALECALESQRRLLSSEWEQTGTLRLRGALWWFWSMRGYQSEGRRWLEEALAIDGIVLPEVRAMALAGVGELAFDQGETPTSSPRLTLAFPPCARAWERKHGRRRGERVES
jgi:hypothetical protein